MKLEGVKAVLAEDGYEIFIEVPGMHLLDRLQKVTIETTDQLRILQRVEEDDGK